MPVDHPQGVEPLLLPQPRHKVVDAGEGDHPVPPQRARMDMADGPVGIVRQAVHRLDRQHRALEGAHPVKGERQHHHADDRIGADLVPRAVQGHQPVDHPAPGRHPQHHREHHAERLRPVGQRGVVQVVRAGPDVEEDQRPEVDDRQAVGIDRPVRLLGDEVIHHRQEARGEEEAHRVVAIPPLGQRILHAGKGRVAFGAQKADRDRQIIDHVQHRHGDDEGEVEPVGDIDVRLVPPQDRADEHREIGEPDNRQPQIDIPFGLGIFLRLGDAEKVTGRGQHDEQLVTPEHEAGHAGEGQRGAAGALHHVEAGRQQRIAAEGEDHRAGVQRAHPAKIEVGFEIEPGKRQLCGDVNACEQARDAPEHGRDHAPADHVVIIARWPGRHPEDALRACHRIIAAERGKDQDHRDEGDNPHVDGKPAVRCQRDSGNGCEQDQRPDSQPSYD